MGRLFFRYWLPVFLWMLLIFALSSVPGGRIPKVPIPQFDKAGHFVEYGILGILLIRALIRSRPRIRALKLSFGALVMALLFGILDEGYQAFVPGRQSDPGDVLSDALFASLGVILYLRCRRGAVDRF